LILLIYVIFVVTVIRAKNFVMKRILSGIVVTFLMQGYVLAQTSAAEGKIEYQKGEKPAAVIELPYSQEIVEGALKDKLTKVGVKEERLKGMQVFKGARLTPTDGEVADLYFKVERNGKKEDNRSTVYLILGRPNENVALRTPNDAYRLQDAKTFLNNLAPVVDAYNLELNITQQEELIKKSEKNLKSLMDDQKQYEDKIRDLQDKITQNKLDQDAQTAELNKQRATRDALISKRASK
jgi:hypothetical protein